MGCEEIRDLLALYVGGESHGPEREAVEAHVSLCAACARELDQYREMRAALAEAGRAAPPAGAVKAVWQAVRAECFPRPARPGLRVFDSALRCAALLMVGLAVGVAIHVARRGPVPQPAAVSPLRAEGMGASAAADRGEARAVISAPPLFPVDVPPRFRLVPPRLPAEDNAYLPRVEAVPAAGEKDF
jgi:anti-sigma factor RsiW